LATVYQEVLGERFGLLHPTLRRFFGDERGGRASGRLKVTRAAGRLRSLAASALGLPPAGDYDVLLEVVPHGAGQRWVRHFGQHLLTTDQGRRRELLLESSGPAGIGFALTVADGALLFRGDRAWLCGVPLPRWLVSGLAAENTPADSGGWRVRVCFRLPLLGLVGEYEGEVIPLHPKGGPS
jgi:hypothetical protein